MVSFYPRIIYEQIHPNKITFENYLLLILLFVIFWFFLVFWFSSYFYLVIFISEFIYFYFLSLFLMHDISICKFSSLKLHIFDNRHLNLEWNSVLAVRRERLQTMSIKIFQLFFQDCNLIDNKISALNILFFATGENFSYCDV